tara:strand:+ start:115 stop:1314 length:1200 start_codon:yes stop_codon:yes gene_type:complete
MLGSFNLDKTYQYLLIALAFLLPLTVFGGNLIIGVIVLLWLFSGNYRSKSNQIISSKLMVASILFFVLHVIGMFWTEDLEWGFHIIHKMWYFLLLYPILYTIVKRENIELYISAFLLAISITEVLSYLIWFEIIEPFKYARAHNPTPFMSHISYNPILAFAIYLVLHKILIIKDLGKFKFFLYSIFALSMSINMFITGGRAGQVMYFVMLGILSFQFYNSDKIKALFLSLILIPVVFFSAYQTSDIFSKRVDAAYNTITNYSENITSGVGKRLSFAANSWEIIRQNPFVGVGTGDFLVEYEKINMVNSPSLPNTTNPHNMYILVLVQLGLLGLASLISIFYYQIKFSFYASNRFIRDVGFTLPVLFLVIMLSDSYLLGHYTTLMFIFFSSFLHKDFEKS